MKRLFYPKNTLLGLWMQKNSNIARHQDQIFIKSILATIRSKHSIPFTIPHNKQSIFKQKLYNKESLQKIHEQMLDLAIQQQQMYATNYYLQHLHLILLTLNKHSKSTSMIATADSLNNTAKDLVDPDKFPIWDLRQKILSYVSLWSRVMGKIRYDIGFQMIVRQSRVQHIQGTNGVYLAMRKKDQNGIIPIGTLLGFVPGSVYSNIRSYRKIRLQKLGQYQKQPYYLQFPSGRILEFEQINYETNSQSEPQPIKVEPTYINPLALGHMINHPPPGCSPNVTFIELNMPIKFFPRYMKKYLPYNYCLEKLVKKETTNPIYVIVNTAELKHNDELYVNYFENHIFQYRVDDGQENKFHQQDLPQWIIDPIPCQIKKYLEKKEYQHPPKIYWQFFEDKILKEKQKYIQKYRKQVNYQPQKVIYEDPQKKIRILARKGKKDILQEQQ